MNKFQDKIYLIGIALPHQTTNENNQASIDCGSLWQAFSDKDIVSAIPGKEGNEVYAVYHSYDGDHTMPYSYFIGCRATVGTEVPEGLNSLYLSEGSYREITAKGKMPDCVADAWREIWKTDFQRTYQTDYEVYDEKSADWNDAEVRIYLGIQS